MIAKRSALALLALVGIVAAALGVSWIPAQPVLAALASYAAAVLTLAHAVGMPPARTLLAATLIALAGVAILLRGLRHAVDLLLWILGTTNTTGISALKAATR